MLEIQASLIGRLAAEDNRMKGLVAALEPSDTSLDERVKQVGEVIRALQYRE